MFMTNDRVITLVHQYNGTLASAMVKDSAGEYRFKRLFNGYDDDMVKVIINEKIDYLERF